MRMSDSRTSFVRLNSCANGILQNVGFLELSGTGRMDLENFLKVSALIMISAFDDTIIPVLELNAELVYLSRISC